MLSPRQQEAAVRGIDRQHRTTRVSSLDGSPFRVDREDFFVQIRGKYRTMFPMARQRHDRLAGEREASRDDRGLCIQRVNDI
jgi:hypothetical protein